MIPLSNEFGFACHEETNWVWSSQIVDGSGFRPITQISFYHNWNDLKKFKVENYSRLRRDDNSQFKSQSGRNLGDYAKKMGIKPQTTTMSSYGEINRTIVPVCYGGNFLFRKKGNLIQSRDFWERIESSLSRSNNIAEGHFMERLWGTILARPLNVELANRILIQEQGDACEIEPNHLGALCK